MGRVSKRLAKVGLVVVLLCGAWGLARRYLLRPSPAAPDAATKEHLARSRIVRDTYGVPHVFGDRDADAAFALAFANAEDDYPTIQLSLAAGRGQLGFIAFGELAVANDYYTELVRVQQEVDATWERLPPDVRAVLEAYTRGLNYWVYLHPDDADTRLLPWRGRDIAAAFAHKLPIMMNVHHVVMALRSDAPPQLGAPVFPNPPLPSAGSNAQALAASRSTDAVARLIINSHQPWEGPVAWYEAHVTSKEGWDITGGTFPGAPMILHGHNRSLGWAHTVNAPDLIDVYKLVTDDQHPGQYQYDGKWLPFEITKARLELDVWLFNVVFHEDAYSSVLGPVLVTKQGAYAFRYAGIGRRVDAITEWFRMNKATSLDEFRAAMRGGGIPMFNTIYADANHLFYVYNALLPVRREGFDYRTVLPGDRSEVVFTDYLPFDELPQVLDPAAGFVQSCNSSPFTATLGDDNPSPARFSATAAVETQESNRSLRSLTLLDPARKPQLTRGELLEMKWDQRYDARSAVYTRVIEPLLKTFQPRDADETRAVELLRAWDGTAPVTSREAALILLTLRSADRTFRGEGDPHLDDLGAAFRDVIAFLKKKHGRIDPTLGEVQRLRRGAVDLPVGGGVDLMNAIYGKRGDGLIVGTGGDSLVVVVDFPADGGTRSESIHAYGASARPSSPHYNDQSKLFVDHTLKPTWHDEAELAGHTERSYAPGEGR